MNHAERLHPIAVKQRAKQQAFALIGRGYVQARETVDCPICSLRFLLLFDRKDRNSPGREATAVHLKAVRYFLVQVKEDHLSGHLHDKFAMPGFVRTRNPAAKIMESSCVFCEKKIGASRVKARLIAMEHAHNCSLNAIRAAALHSKSH